MLPPLGELLVDDPFWQYPAWGRAREGAGHLRVWAAAAASAGYLAVVTETGGITSVTESAGRIWAGLARRYGPASCCSSTTPRRSPARAWRPWTWSASALTGARTGPAYGRPRRSTRVTPGWNCGWPLTGTRSSAGPRTGSMGVTIITGDCLWHPRDVVRLKAPEAASAPAIQTDIGLFGDDSGHIATSSENNPLTGTIPLCWTAIGTTRQNGHCLVLLAGILRAEIIGIEPRTSTVPVADVIDAWRASEEGPCVRCGARTCLYGPGGK
jgi:hypothetical protein